MKTLLLLISISTSFALTASGQVSGKRDLDCSRLTRQIIDSYRNPEAGALKLPEDPMETPERSEQVTGSRNGKGQLLYTERLRGSPNLAVVRCFKESQGTLTLKQKARITPSNEDFSKYASILKKNRTGLMVLLPEPKCGDGRVVDLKNKAWSKFIAH